MLLQPVPNVPIRKRRRLYQTVDVSPHLSRRRLCFAWAIALGIRLVTYDTPFVAPSGGVPVAALTARRGCSLAELQERRSVGSGEAVAEREATSEELEIDESDWTAVESSVDIEGATARDAWLVYSKLSNHPLWSKQLRVENLGDGTSEWSGNLLGTLTYSWKARILDTGSADSVAWESVSGTKNKGHATFENLPGAAPACRVKLRISFPAPRLVKSMFSIAKVSAALSELLSSDLHRFRDVVLNQRAAIQTGDFVMANETHSDRLGSCKVVLRNSGRIEVTNSGFGTSGTTNALLEDLSAGLDNINEDVNCYCLLDLRSGLGCTPAVVGDGVRFLSGYGPRIKRIAVVAPLPLATLARLIQQAARQPGFEFFSNVDHAEEWLAKPMTD